MSDELTEVLVPEVAGAVEIRDWLRAHNLTFNDYIFAGRGFDNRLLFKFKDKDAAMLFKLTFGG